MSYVRTLDTLGRHDLALAGGKGANLGELISAGLPVPAGFVVTTEAYRRILQDTDLFDPTGRASASPSRSREVLRTAELPDGLREEILAAYAELGSGPVAVRSSATAEDLAEASFAGQQETYLNIAGPDALLGAIRDCWASLWSERAVAYRRQHGAERPDLALAVVVQKLVPAKAAGVMFTANPANGRRHETVVSAAWGLGESVVGGAATTDDYLVDERQSRVLEARVAIKTTMTVVTATGTAEAPVPEPDRQRRVLTDTKVLRLAELGRRAADHFGTPQDLEWVLDTAETLWIVQSRPITALPDPVGPVPGEWPLPDDGKNAYFRGSIIEQLPDPLTPLFGDLAGTLVVPGMVRTISTWSTGWGGGFSESDMSFPLINGYAYYGMNNALMVKMTGMLTRIGTIFGDGPDSGVVRWRDRFHPRYAEVVNRWRQQPFAELTAAALLEGVTELAGECFAYYTSVQTIIPGSAMTEILFTSFYDRLVKRPGDPAAETFLLGFDSSPILAEKSLFALADWLRDHGLDAAVAELREVPATPPAGVDTALWQDFVTRWHEHLARFGHAVYNLDFVNPVPTDDPTPLLDTLRFFLSGGGQDPAERQRTLAARRDAAAADARGRLNGVRLSWFNRLLAAAQARGPLREDALADMGLAWPTVRRMARELGRRLVADGVLDEADDVFWLYAAELATLADQLDRGTARGSLHEQVADRKATWRGRKLVRPPAILPERTGWRFFEAMMPSVLTEQTGPVIRGTGASGGRVTGPARVLHGPADFGTMEPGEILVASITTPAWTPLFTKAAAVVTDIGGPLSHSSIVAREYGIPAVLGTEVATTRIATGDTITVDGAAGQVILGDGSGSEAEVAEPAGRRWPWTVAACVAALTGLVVVRRLRG